MSVAGVFAVLHDRTDLDVKQTYWVAKNIKGFANEVSAIEEARGFEKEYLQKREEILIKYAMKDEQGNPVIENDSYKVNQSEEFINAYNALAAEYEPKQTEFVEFMNGDVDVPVYKIKADNMPKVSPVDLLKIWEFVEE